ncbi:MAG TPA: nitrilase-related carbon-nitrogen hydrolase [Allosphingosinicella sp.]|jgi:apolipoprotein N-acyltransferase|nr:nitrilase-related carbon-nitrogen hydrolase [Allosphingosinicella sp.]
MVPSLTAFPRIAVALALALVGGALLAFGYANNPLWWAAWLAPAPALAAVLYASARFRFPVGLAVGLVAGCSTFGYHVTTGSATAAIVISLAYALAWGGALRIAAEAAERWPAMIAALVLPASWAAIDTLLIHFSPHGSAGSLAYSQAGVLPVLQIVSLGGVPAVTWLLLLPGSLAGLALARRLGSNVRSLSQATLFTGLIVAGVLLFGWSRLEVGAGLSNAPVAMIASDSAAPGGRTWERFMADYRAAIEEAARPGVTVLLPEAVIRTDLARSRHIARTFAAFARARRATLVVGVVVDEGGRVTNRALVATPAGHSAYYAKQHLVPGLERGTTPGDRNLLFASPAGRTGVAICKDMHFPTLGRSYALDGAQLMLVPALDFDVDDRMMAAVTAIRGIEGGYAVARAARRGLSFVSDPYGRIVAEQRSGAATVTLIARAPLALSTRTFYARAGDLFGWVCVAAWLGMVLALRFGRAAARPRHGRVPAPAS